jgi:ribosomal protein L37AE/L43A
VERGVTGVQCKAVENAQPEVVPAAENVVRLADYRAKRRARAQRAALAQGWGPQYYCLRCDGDEFKLYASGVVHCAHCGSLMRNLFIGGGKSEEPAQ